MKVLLVGINSKYIHSNLAIRYLKAFTKDLNFHCDTKEYTINERIENIVPSIMEEKADIIAFSTYIWNLEYVTKISKIIKLIDPSIEIIYGGPEVSYDGEEFLLNNSGDYVIEGEGEETFREFIKRKMGIIEENHIKGLYEKKSGNVIYGGKRPLMDMNKLVFPYEEDEDLVNKIVYFEGSRGCPFNCKYCLSSTIHGVRFLNTERVKRELEFLIKKDVKLIKFVDRTFNCNSKFSMEIWEFLSNINTTATFHFEISADILKRKEIELLSKAPKGRFQFEVGVQTTNDEVLKNINRNVNFSDIKEKIEELQSIKNIKQHLDLIAGLPGEDYESFKRSFNDVYSIKPEEVQLGFLKLLKGAPMTQEADKWGMVYSPYPPYEILKTDKISYEKMTELKSLEAMVDKYYNSQKFVNIIKYFEKRFENSFEFFNTLAMFYKEKGYFKRNLSSVEYYKVFIEFNEEVVKCNYEDELLLKEIVKFDYMRFNKKKWLPMFLNRNISKKDDKKLKEYIKTNYSRDKNYHGEAYEIDIIKYISCGKFDKNKSYLLYDEEDWQYIKDITEEFKNY
ncbi:B12-binding domain-containing radical SAM protein [Clostridium algidicarnis]|uniref:B12-binding domain-containing radical SAM protein n=1 Tax=Clostridium algidicarnis TaxID=37659 RepID=UPI003FD7B101